MRLLRAIGKGGEALEVVVGVAELLRDHRQAPERVAHLQLLAHAHAAVQLHRFLADVAAGVGDLDLRGRHGARSRSAASARYRPSEQARHAIERACS